MRARNLRPEFFTDRKMAALGVKHAIIYQSLWLLADDGGVCRCDPDYVKAQIFYLWPDVSPSDIATALREYYRSARVRLYAISDELYCEIAAFAKHQKPNNPSKFRYPRGGQELTEEATVALCESYHTPTLPVPVPVPVPSKLLPEMRKKPRISAPVENWVAALGDWWVEEIGAVNYGQLGKVAKDIHRTRGPDAIKAAARRYFGPNGKQAYKSLADFFATFAQWDKATDAPTPIRALVPQAEAPSDRLRRMGAL